MNKVTKYTIEIVVIIAILLAVLFGLSKVSPNLFRSKQPETPAQSTITNKYERKQILITFEATQKKADVLSKVKVGDKLFDYDKTTALGEIVSLSEVRPYRQMVKDYDTNSFILAPVEDYYDQDITVSVKADIFEKYIMVGATDLKIGYTLSLINDKYLLNCVITGIEILDEKPEVKKQ